MFVMFSVQIHYAVKLSGFCDALFPITVNQKMGYIDCNGKEVVLFDDADVSEFNDGVGNFGYGKEGSGIVMPDGKIVNFNPFKLWSNFSEGLALAETPENKFVFITKDKKIRFVLPSNIAVDDTRPIVGNFKEGINSARLIDDSIIFIDTNGKILFSRNYDAVDDFSGGIATVDIGNKNAVIDKKGKYIIRPSISGIYASHNGIVRIKEGKNKWKYVNNQGKVILKTNYDYCGDFIDGLAVVEKNGKYGFINKKGKLVVPLKYDEAHDFSDGLAEVEINNKIGFINNTGREVISTTIFGVVVSQFKHGLAYIRTNTEEGYINKSGSWIWKKK